VPAEGIDIGVVDMYSVTPIDTDAIRRAAQKAVVITAEEHHIGSRASARRWPK
jgi:transketolase C-terminal domain/subunit